MSKKVKVKLFKKAVDIADINSRIESKSYSIETIDIQKTIKFDQGRYDMFCNNMLDDMDCLGGLDYSNNNKYPAAIEIICPGQQTIYITPEGFDYPRYVGVGHIERKESDNGK